MYVPSACTKKNFEIISPIIPVLGHIFLIFGHFESIQALFLALLARARAMLSWGPGQIVIVYVPRACTKKNPESISPIVLILGHILPVFGHFEPLQPLFEPPDPGPGYAKLGAGSNCHCTCP